MEPKTFKPGPELGAFVKHILVMEGNDQQISLFADGCPGIIYQQTEGLLIADQRTKKLPVFLLYGQTIKPIQLCLRNSNPVIVFQLYPHVVKSLFGFSPKELTDDCLDLNEIPFVYKNRIQNQITESEVPGKQMETIRDFILGHIRTNEIETDPVLQSATENITNTKGQIPIRQISKFLSIPERTFERKFEDCVGVSPKVFAKISQFQASLWQLNTRNFDKLSDVALDNGYADQSHFIRRFREFTGYTPKDYLKQSSPLVLR